MTIDLQTFSLGKTLVSVERYTGSYTDGIFSKSLASAFQTWASVQPYNTIEQDLIFEPNAGERVEEILIMYTNVKIYQSDNSSTNPTSDIVLVLGKSFKPVKVENWIFLNTEHYRVLLKRFDGP
jgi:hypothetical protein